LPRPRFISDEAVVAEVQRLVEATTLSQLEIARQTGVPSTTVSMWKRRERWTRPSGAPPAPSFAKGGGVRMDSPAARSERRAQAMVDRLYRVFGRGLSALETRVGRDKDGLEKDARALATLAKTLETLKALDRDDGAKHPDSDGVDPDEMRARLARKLFAMGQSGE
jgi:hypothetical protein